MKYLRSIHFTGYTTDEVDTEANTSHEVEIDYDQVHEILYSDLMGNPITNDALKYQIESAYLSGNNDLEAGATRDTSGS